MVKKLLVSISILVLVFLAACNRITGMPNPASVFCTEQGGSVVIRKDEQGNEFGVCVFPDGTEVDEWAFYHGEATPAIEKANLPNPASVFCEEQGGKLEITSDENGAQFGMCKFDDGSQCEEWSFFRGECQPGTLNPGNDIAEDGCIVYRNKQVGYSFHLPKDAIVVSADDPQHTLTIQGPMVGDEYWPVIFINTPFDRPEFNLPEGETLADWLASNQLLAGELKPGRLIAGVEAVHLRENTGPQAYDSDRYFIALNGNIYNIVILHTGDKEDWTVYDHFLDNFQID